MKFDHKNIIFKIIKNNNYMKKYKCNTSKDFHSLSYIVNKKLSHSDCIKIGIAIEKILVDIVLEYNKDLENIRPKNLKNKHEKDHLFFNSKNNTIYYSELKGNLNLDTEKIKMTKEKYINIVEELKKQYPDNNIKWCLLGLRYTNQNKIPSKIKNKYIGFNKYLYGINDYFKLLDINIKYTERTYKEFINIIVDEMII